MRGRNEFTIDGGGRLFTQKNLEEYRRELCQELRRVNKSQLAERYEQMSIMTFAVNGGYVIIDYKRNH